MGLAFEPLTPARWPDLVDLFGPRGACGGCWCMTWRLARSDYERLKGAGNRRAFRRIVACGPPPGILAYRDGRAAGWCAVAPRGAYPRLAGSRILARVDEAPVWSITCLYVAPAERRRGLSVRLLRAASDWAAGRGARIVEGYPVEPRTDPMPPVFAFTGLAPAFEAAGFREVARRSPTRPIMRRGVGTRSGPRKRA
jgi:GNAT superfamily N-acetyltransferase